MISKNKRTHCKGTHTACEMDQDGPGGNDHAMQCGAMRCNAVRRHVRTGMAFFLTFFLFFFFLTIQDTDLSVYRTCIPAAAGNRFSFLVPFFGTFSSVFLLCSLSLRICCVARLPDDRPTLRHDTVLSVRYSTDKQLAWRRDSSQPATRKTRIGQVAPPAKYPSCTISQHAVCIDTEPVGL